MSAKVSLCKDDDPKIATKRAIEGLGGMQNFAKNDETVLLKPNLCCTKTYESGATTDTRVLAQIIDMVLEVGANPIVIESPIVGYDTDQVFFDTGIKSLVKEKGIEYFNLLKGKFVEVEIPDGLAFDKIQLPEIVVAADKFINVPVLKTHLLTGITCCLKNIIGILPDDLKRACHRNGINKAIVDINRPLNITLNVVDAFIAMEGSGPTGGKPVDLRTVIAGVNSTATDAVACSLVGVDPKKVKHIKLAGENGLGIQDLKEIEVINSDIVFPVQKFKMPFGISLISTLGRFFGRFFS